MTGSAASVESRTGGWLALADMSVTRLRGSAVRAFLSRQLTCEVAALAPGRPLLGAWLSAKGRVLTLVRLVDPGDGTVLVLMPAELAEEVARRMRMFVLRDDVTLEAAPGLAVAGVSGDAVAAAVTASGAGGLPAVVPVAAGVALVLAEPPSLGALLADLEARGARALEPDGWRLALVRSGVPEVLEATREAFIPQMLNLDRLDAVSFSKGCYPGQEIVARTQHLGRIKRRMFIARCGSGSPRAAPGDAIAGGADGGGDAAGRVVLSGSDGGAQEMLAVLSLEAVAAGEPLRLGGPGGPVLEVRPPPYPLDGPGA